jgi:hypothetical protein
MHEETNLMEILLRPTPISHRMLMAAWDDLSFESQCEILLAYNKNREVGRLNVHTDEFLEKALKSTYPLVRYLASKVLFGSKFEKIIISDPHPLVSSSNMLDGCDYCVLDNGKDKFISMTHNQRIEKLSYSSSYDGFVDLMQYFKNESDTAKFKKHEVYEMVLAYLKNPYVKRRLERTDSDYGPEMGGNWYFDDKEKEDLKKLLLIFPELNLQEEIRSL